MKPKKRQKLCYNCEGDVDLDVIVCPFCAADLRAEKPEQHRNAYNLASSVKNLETQESLYARPQPYSPKASVETAVAPSSEEEIEPSGLVEEEASEEPRSIVGPTLLLTLGVQLFLFGILMLIFQNNGAMILKWDARMWFLYLFASVPLLVFGYRSVSKL